MMTAATSSRNYRVIQGLLILLCLFYSFHLSEAQPLLKLQTKVKQPQAIHYSRDSKYLLVATGFYPRLYSASSETLIRELDGNVNGLRAGHKYPVFSISFSPTNALVATGSGDRTIKLWNYLTGEVAATLQGHSAPITGMVFLDSDKHLASISEDRTLRIWDTETMKALYVLSDHKSPLRTIDVSPDARMLVTAGGDSVVKIRDARTGEVLKELKGHRTWVRAVAWSPDGKLLSSADDSGRLLLWDTQSWSVVRKIVQRGWTYDLEFSADGKYLAAANEKNQVIFYETHSGIVALRLDKFKNPVRGISLSPNGKELATIEEMEPYVKYWDIEALSITPIFRFRNMNDLNPPQIFVSNPPAREDGKYKYGEELLRVTGTVLDDSGLRNLRINGQEVPVRSNGNFIVNIGMMIGDNPITIEATDINDNTSVKRLTVTRRTDWKEIPYDPSKSRNFLFVVSINRYAHWPQLKNAVNDGQNLKDVLTNVYNFDSAHTKVLLDEQATRNNIFEQLRSYAETITPADNLVIYFSGHGYFDELLNEGYWIPAEANRNAQGEYLANSTILKILANVNSQHTLLVADACFSGSLFGEPRRGFADNVEKIKSRWGLASGRLEAVSDGKEGQNSPFATQLIRILRENNKPKLTVSELIQSVKLSVPEHAEQTPIGNPLKIEGDDGGEFVFYRRTKDK